MINLNPKLPFIAILAIVIASCTEKADTVICGKAFTADDGCPYVSRVAIKDGVIVYAGDDASAFIGKDTEIIQSEGLVTPGFADVHAHGAEAMRLYDLVRDIMRDTLSSTGNPFNGNEPSEEDKEKCIISFQNLLILNGITSYQDAYANYPGFDLCETYEKLDREGKIIVHTYGAYFLNEESDVRSLDSLMARSASCKGGNFELNSVKYILDGTIEDHKAYKSAVWAGDSSSTFGFWPDRRLASFLVRTSGCGLSFHAHAVGDGALSLLLNKAPASADPNIRNCAVHLAIVNADDLKRMHNFDLTAVITPYCFYRDTSLFDSLLVRTLGKEDAGKLYPAKMFLESGVNIAYGSDFPVSNSLSVTDAIYKMVERKREPLADSTSLWSEQKISVEEALKCVTSGGAYLLGRDDKSGSIAVGKAADIVFLDKDITTCPTDEIREAVVVRTMIGGRTVYLPSEPVR